MIAELSKDILSTYGTLSSEYLNFLEELKELKFAGDIQSDYANRVVLATDNSIYQVLPQAVVYPKDISDLIKLATLSNQSQYSSIVLSPRGGGTGTNGQSLTDGVVVDVSKHMNQIIEINVEERWARVQAGVVKDHLNQAVAQYGLFFAPELSTSNRATIGGMVNTDASGQGSVMYGKTRDHVLALKSVLLDGTVWESGPIDDQELDHIKQRSDRVGEVHRVVDQIFTEQQEQIEQTFPKLNRCLTGYDLAHIREEDGLFNLNSVLVGAEGSLAFVAEAKVNLVPIPKFSSLVNIQYTSFDQALRDATELMEWNPGSIETVDSNVLDLAKEDIVWHAVGDFFPEHEQYSVAAINFVEFVADSQQELDVKLRNLTDHLDALYVTQSGRSFAYTIASGDAEVKRIWAMRKKSVGLLGNTKGDRRPIPFVEDAAVPPENLADFIVEFRALLDSYGLAYGMFGHVDAGVLHVRPAVNMKDEVDETLIRSITDQLVVLTRKYKGLLWGEHGKGVRSEYAPEFFGNLYPYIQEVKGGFDPHNQLNPGKIATPAHSGAQLLKIDQVSTRGQFDRQVSAPTRDEYDSAMNCNGNGACFNFDPNDAMCPSWKGTRKRTHSPKGRASLIREWLRLQEKQGVDLSSDALEVKENWLKRWSNTRKQAAIQDPSSKDFNVQIFDSMSQCLACKSCVGQCPIKVNVPEFRSKFLAHYYTKYSRPLKDYFIGTLEFIIPTVSKFPGLYNGFMNNASVKKGLEHFAGMVDSPLLSEHSLRKQMTHLGIRFASPKSLAKLTEVEKQRSVVLVQDAFTSFFEAPVVLDAIQMLQKLGFTVWLAPFRPNGKPLHVHGMLGQFNKAAKANSEMLNEISDLGVALVGVDPSMTLTYRQEYLKCGGVSAPHVMLLQEWLSKNISLIPKALVTGNNQKVSLLAHCTEKTTAPDSMKDWQRIFEHFGFQFRLEQSGCCGMSGTFGHEVANVETSRQIYAQSWANILDEKSHQTMFMATGYSCRSQVKRFDNTTIPHPFQVLLKQASEK
ncbi:MAG: FAD-binding and (Fe-S)-binding domain-containing protein [Pseudomonadota bacterium]|nr:FAD-binding and (Fe-S)-binding domain-containing protein [Pseudomonadota bacterium]